MLLSHHITSCEKFNCSLCTFTSAFPHLVVISTYFATFLCYGYCKSEPVSVIYQLAHFQCLTDTKRKLSPLNVQTQ